MDPSAIICPIYLFYRYVCPLLFCYDWLMSPALFSSDPSAFSWSAWLPIPSLSQSYQHVRQLALELGIVMFAFVLTTGDVLPSTLTLAARQSDHAFFNGFLFIQMEVQTIHMMRVSLCVSCMSNIYLFYTTARLFVRQRKHWYTDSHVAPLHTCLAVIISLDYVIPVRCLGIVRPKNHIPYLLNTTRRQSTVTSQALLLSDGM